MLLMNPYSFLSAHYASDGVHPFVSCAEIKKKLPLVRVELTTFRYLTWTARAGF